MEQPPIEAQHSDTNAQGVGKTALKAVHEELENAQRPLHISEIMRLLAGREVSLPGAGEQANLISHVRRDERFVRTARGMYALAAWGLTTNQAPTVRARRQRIRSGPKR